MKQSLVLSLSALLLSACASSPVPNTAPVVAAPQAPALASDGSPRVAIGGVEIQKVEFRPGVSSATVEQLARFESCRGGYGAGLLTQSGPVEIYRMACDNGKVFMAKCELRQCKQM
jgi:hypothetical protein